MKSKTVTIEADGVCTLKGKSTLKLQDADPVKAKKSKSSGTPKAETDKATASAPSPKARKGQAGSIEDVQTGAPSEGGATQDKSDPSREKGPLWVRIDMPPKLAEQVGARFVLTSSDQSISMTLTVRDNMEPGNETVDLLYEDLWKDLSYSLRVEEGSEQADVIFEDVPYDQLAGLAGSDQDGDSSGDELDIDEVEAVRPSGLARIDLFANDAKDS
jgi:hypothetical protein